jgi:hypothetical protein
MTAMGRALEALGALDADDRGARARDVRAHGVQAVREVLDLRLTRGVFEDGRAFRQRGGQHGVLGGPDARHGEVDVRALQAVDGGGLHIALLDFQVRAHGFQRLQVQVDRPGADGTAAGQ